MARTSVKSTFSLDVETARALERLSQRWDVPKSEVVRRAVRAAEEGEQDAALGALDELQRSLGMTRTRSERWLREVRSEREVSSARSERR